MRAVTSQEMGDIETSAIEQQGLSISILMDRAGAAVAAAASSSWVNTSGKKAAVFCGKGHNGGDGFVAARILAEEGANVSVFILANDKDDLKQESREALAKLEKTLARIIFNPGNEAIRENIATTDIIIDCIFGFGLTGAVVEPVSNIINIINESSAEVLAVDVPSGVEADSGHVHGSAIKADWTITFTLPKVGCLIYPGAEYAGELQIEDIGISIEEMPELGRVNILEDAEYTGMLPQMTFMTHKHNRGTVLVIAGSAGMTGAATLTAQAALRCGAGIVTVGIPASLNVIFEIKLTEVMTVPLPETQHQSISLEAFDQIAELAESFDVLAIGPGLSLDPSTVDLVRRVVSEIDVPIVIDADGLNALVGEGKRLRERTSPTIITPHPKELARLLKASVDDIQSSRIDMTLEAAENWQCYIVLKGARTIIASPQGHCLINRTGNPGLATAGTGDVLTGAIAAFLAQTKEPFNASALGTYLHGLAGDIAEDQMTQHCMVAHDVIDNLACGIRHLLTS